MSKKILWQDVASGTHGLNITPSQANAWEEMLVHRVDDLKNSEICLALEEAMDREEEYGKYHITVNDLVRWIKSSRNKWAEKTYVSGEDIYFPSRERACGGQIQSGTATPEEVAHHKNINMYASANRGVPREWMERI